MGQNSRNKEDKGRIRERLTPGPLTHLSLSLRLRSLSLQALSLSLRESLEQVMHKGSEQSLNSKRLDFIIFFAKRVHLFIGRGERRKVTLENQGTGGEGASGDVEVPPRAQ